MRLSFCDHHIQAFFLLYDSRKIPLDLALGNYFRAHKSLGAKDRKCIGDTTYSMVRWKSLIDHLCPSPATSIDRLHCFRSLSLDSILQDTLIPEYIRCGIPEWLFHKLVADYGKEKTWRLCQTLNTPASPTIRANLLKTTREALLEKWKGQFPASLCKYSPSGIRFAQRLPLFSLPEFKEGLFEMQDEGSQLVASLIAANPGDSVLDFCSGSGGKALAFAPQMKGRGQIYLHDVRPSVLREAKQRLKRAGIQNGQILPPGHGQLSRLKGKCDWVLIDVPCSGTGTMRRNPDQKWNLEAPMLQQLIEKQQQIATEAIAYLKPGGRLVYATCSILSEENQSQVERLLASHPLSLETSPLSLLPEEEGPDGFFAALFRKK
ncbi:MAG: methyltransferase domain-containing protein [Chlamydiia bacterium]|nr:methyltransferase domain-containing protein [Chlamydiia bacterium]